MDKAAKSASTNVRRQLTGAISIAFYMTCSVSMILANKVSMDRIWLTDYAIANI